MKVVLLLHAYQPSTQFPHITKMITRESYIPVIDLLIRNSKARVVLNVVGSLTEQLGKHGQKELLKKISYLSNQHQIELTGCAAYHPLLTQLPFSEIARQNKLNSQINSKIFGKTVYSPQGFFIPEMLYDDRVGRAVAKLGYKWTILDETAYPYYQHHKISRQVHKHLKINQRFYQLSDTKLFIFFRNSILTNILAFEQNIHIKDFIKSMQQLTTGSHESFIILALDMETFGHHHPKGVNFLQRLISHPQIELITISKLLKQKHPIETIDPIPSTWGMSNINISGDKIFPRWLNFNNPIHVLQWDLYNLALKNYAHDSDQPDTFDKAVQSDTFWWASHNPIWHPEMVERGSAMLRNVVFSSNKSSTEDKDEAKTLYGKILTQGKELYGDEVIE